VKRIFLWLIILALIVIGAIAVRIAIAEVQPYKGYAESEQFVEIPAGAGPGSIGRRLVDAGVIRDTLGFRFELARSGAGRRLGAWRHSPDISASSVQVSSHATPPRSCSCGSVLPHPTCTHTTGSGRRAAVTGDANTPMAGAQASQAPAQVLSAAKVASLEHPAPSHSHCAGQSTGHGEPPGCAPGALSRSHPFASRSTVSAEAFAAQQSGLEQLSGACVPSSLRQ
jgi:hypothetical protein